ncbi:MAG: class I SAM-dependent methyltransferase [Caulobacteraceae bacterium]
MKLSHFAAAAAVALVGSAALAATIPNYIVKAVDNPNRPAADHARDTARKPAEVLTFAGVRPGEDVLELIPGGGYFTRMLSVAVGPKGHVTEAVPRMGGKDVSAKSNGVAGSANFPNVSEIPMTAAAISKIAPVNLVWTSQNYHDLHLTRAHVDVVGLDRLIYSKLKPGGVFFIEDHAAKPGSGISTTDAMHRIDEDFVKREVESVGFKLAGESNVLRNPADNHTLSVFNPAIRGHTDQFLLKFRKPA